jgi:putative ABC transport system permease protein
MTLPWLLLRRSLARHRLRVLLVTFALGLALALPLALALVLDRARDSLHARAAATPLVAGARGSPIELCLAALYPDPAVLLPPELPHRELAQLAMLRAATASAGAPVLVPLHLGHRAQQTPIIGTEVDYLDFRGLRLAAGTSFLRLGDCVLGASAARRRGLAPGGMLLPSPTAGLDLGGGQPVALRITGVLAASGGPDDEAAFCDLRTAWMLSGFLHGHGELEPAQVQAMAAGVQIARAGIAEHRAVEASRRRDFHAHGDPGGFPIHAVLLRPADERAAALIEARFRDPGQPIQLVRPDAVIAAMLANVLRLRAWILLGLLLTGGATVLIAVALLTMAARARAAEFASLARIGASPAAVRFLRHGEQIAVVLLALLLAGALLAPLLLLDARWILLAG